MNARLDVEDLLGLQTGEAHIISNAGGVVTEDALRCLIITHHLLDTNEFILPTTPAAACSRSEPRPDVETGAQLWPPAMQLLPNRKRRPAAAQGVAA